MSWDMSANAYHMGTPYPDMAIDVMEGPELITDELNLSALY